MVRRAGRMRVLTVWALSSRVYRRCRSPSQFFFRLAIFSVMFQVPFCQQLHKREFDDFSAFVNLA